MFPAPKPRTFQLWGKKKKGRNAYTQAYALARESDHTLGTDAPLLIEQQPIDRKNAVVPGTDLDKPQTEAQVLSEELLSNDSLGG